MSRIFTTSYSVSESISIGGGGSGCQPGIVETIAGSSKDTWKTGWICQRANGRPNWKACEDTLGTESLVVELF